MRIATCNNFAGSRSSLLLSATNSRYSFEKMKERRRTLRQTVNCNKFAIACREMTATGHSNAASISNHENVAETLFIAWFSLLWEAVKLPKDHLKRCTMCRLADVMVVNSSRYTFASNALDILFPSFIFIFAVRYLRQLASCSSRSPSQCNHKTQEINSLVCGILFIKRRLRLINVVMSAATQ